MCGVMKFEYKKECSLQIGQELYGIIEVSRYTKEGVFPIKVFDIDYNNERICFEVEQPCETVSCSFSEVENFVFESEEEAKNTTLEFGVGLQAYHWIG